MGAEVREYQDFNEYIETAHHLAEQDKFDEALEILREAILLPDITDEDIALARRVEERIEQARRSRIDELKQNLINLLGKRPDTLTKEDLNQGERILANLQRIHPDKEQVTVLTEKWRDHRRQGEMFQEIAEVRKELENVWGEVSYAVLEPYHKAFARAQELARKYPQVEEVQSLLKRAEKEFQQAREISGYLTTQTAEASFAEVERELKSLADRGYKVFPIYNWGQDPETGKDTIIVRGEGTYTDALTQLFNLWTTYDTNKAREYLQRARDTIERDPEGAKKWIEDALKKFKRAEPSVREELEQYLEESVYPAIQRREKANQLVQKAREWASQKPLQAWALLEQAQRMDTWAPEIPEVREVVRTHLTITWERELEKAEEVRQSGWFKEARDEAKRILIHAQKADLAEIERVAQALKDRCDADEQLYTYLRKERDAIEELAPRDLAQAERRLKEMKRRLEEADAGLKVRRERFWELVRDAQEAIDSRKELRDLITEWKLKFDTLDPRRIDGFADLEKHTLSEEDLKRLRHMRDGLDELKREIERRKAERSERVQEVEALQEKIKGRRWLIQGRLNWAANRYQAALQAWQEVVRLNTEDTSLAQDWVERAEDATAVERDLERAQRYIERARRRLERSENPLKDLRKAREILEKWLDRPSPKRITVEAKYDEILDLWSRYLENQINAELQKSLPSWPRVEKLISNLHDINPERSERYREEWIKIYEVWGDRSADIARKIHYYEEALKISAPAPRPEIEKKLFRAKRTQLQAQIGSMSDNKEKIHKWREWLKQYASDVVARLNLVKLLLRENALRDAEWHIEQARHYLQKCEEERAAIGSVEDLTQLDKIAQLAGLSRWHEVVEYSLYLDICEHELQARQTIEKAIEDITSRLKVSENVRSYHVADDIKREVEKRLEEIQKKLAELWKSNAWTKGLPEAIQRHVRDYLWDTLEWLKRERTEGRVHEAFEKARERLLKDLIQEWSKWKSVDRPQPLYKVAPHKVEGLKQRWEVGLKIAHFIPDDERAQTVLREITDAEREIKEEFAEIRDLHRLDIPRDLRDDPYLLIVTQQQWVSVLIEWEEFITNIVRPYNVKDAPQGLRGPIAAESIKPELVSYAEHLDTFAEAMREALDSLVSAKEAGKRIHTGRTWSDVPWMRVVYVILQSFQDISNEDSNALQHRDERVRYEAWRRIASVLDPLSVPDNVGRIPWPQINQIIVQSGIEEQWEEVGTMLNADSIRNLFMQHPAFVAFKRKKEKAFSLRNQLILATAMLHIFVYAEEFHKANTLMDLMGRWDPDDTFGFRQFLRIRSRGWEELKKELVDAEEQLRQFQEWWNEVQSSALSKWQTEGRDLFQQYVKRAEYEQAMALLADALYGREAAERVRSVAGFTLDDLYGTGSVIDNIDNDLEGLVNGEGTSKTMEGRIQEKIKEALGLPNIEEEETGNGQTNALGGGISIWPLKKHLENIPLALKAPKSERLRQERKIVDEKKHEVEVVYKELRYWLVGEPPYAPGTPPKEPIYKLKVEFLTKKADLEGVLEALRRAWWPWDKRQLRILCRELLEELHRLAPDWEGYEQYQLECQG